MLDINDSWKLVLEDIKGIINMPTFKTWFENIYPVSFKKNCLTISVNSHFAKEWLETRYVEILSNSIKKNINKDCVFKIIVSPGEELVYSDSDLMPPNKPKQKKTKAVTSRFNHKYTFDTFVIGSGNRFSHAAAQAVSENPGKAYNPLFIYGGVGLGKNPPAPCYWPIYYTALS